ncbi:MAG: shikimate kinase [Actinobacteria bacterium]|nr:MAG: shikimate kinase [Actinomycetota bacterium]
MATLPASGSSDHILLVGMMGAGKSSVGKRVADKLGRPFFDIDSWIEDEEGTSVSTIFETRGEAAFRDLEAKVLAFFLANPVASVLSVGGGAVTEFRNRTAMDGQERVVWLRATDATLVSRVGNGADRPLLAGKDPAAKLARLSRDREPMYTEVADVVVDVDDLTLDDVVDRVVAALR